MSLNPVVPSRNTAATRHLSGGFTLIELLVVVGIIAVLMAVLLPVLGRAREEVYKVQCAANLRQWGSALNSFGGANQRRLPDATRPQTPENDRPQMHPFVDDQDHEWHVFLREYLVSDDWEASRDGDHTVTWCPTQTDRHRYQSHTVMGYFYFPNRTEGGWMWWDSAVAGWLRKDRLDGAYSRAPLMSDEKWTREGGDFVAAGIAGGNAAHLSPLDPTETLGGNFLFEDGSVSWRQSGEIAVGGGWGDREYYFKISIPGHAN